MDRVLQVKLLDEFFEIVGISIQVVAAPRLARPAVPAAIMRDASEAMRGQKEHLVFEGVPGQRPAVTEDNGLPRTQSL
jgi:hypothetical protein